MLIEFVVDEELVVNVTVVDDLLDEDDVLELVRVDTVDFVVKVVFVVTVVDDLLDEDDVLELVRVDTVDFVVDSFRCHRC